MFAGAGAVTGASPPIEVGAPAGAGAPAIAEPEAVLDDLDTVRALAVHPGVALARQQLDQPGRGGPLRD